jgi:predicted ATP-grasp superfamily ATP-dependent carboligase
LSVIRTLGRADIPVCVFRSDEHAVALTSRYVRRRFQLREGSDAQRRDQLIAASTTRGLSGWTLIPTDDEDAALIAREHDALSEHFVLTTPPWDVLEGAYDKRRTWALAQRAGVAHPETHVLGPRDDPRRLALTYPVVVKPAFRARGTSLGPAKAWGAADADALARLWTELAPRTEPGTLLIQERIPGDQQLSCAALCRDGEVLATLTARRRRQYPIDFGRASTFVETTADESLRDDTARLLETMRMSGIVEVEYKRDPRTGENKLLDVNPRAWGWQSLCDRAGVPFPLLVWRMANGEPIPATVARSGVRWVRMLTDVPAAWQELRTGSLTLRRYLRSLRGPLEFAVFSRDDPVPAATDLLLTLGIAASRRLHGRPV